MAETIITSAAEKVLEWLFRLIGERICNMYKFGSNIRKLKEQDEKLMLKKQSVTNDVADAERHRDTIKDEVHVWLCEVDEFAERLAKISNKGDEKKRCFKGLSCPNLKTRYLHSMEAAKLGEGVAYDLLKKGEFSRVANYKSPQRTRSIYVKNDTFASRDSIFEEIMKTLTSSELKTIGVHGMGGVGKTTLVKKVYWQAKVHKLMFDQVVMAEVTQNPDLIKIQGAIADDLCLFFREEGVDARAAKLRERLKEEKKVLVILDDVWKELDLDAIGIPYEDFDQRCCKFLFTSRDRNALKLMKSEKTIHVPTLEHEEAMDLFWGIVKDSTIQSEFEPMALKIVKRCGGLPVAILTISKTLEKVDQALWNDVLNEFESFDFNEVDKDFNFVIELSNKFLKIEEAKSLFLLCGLHEVGHPIYTEDLVKCVMGWLSIGGVNSLKDVRKKVDKWINDLKAASLLLEDEKTDRVKVHDIIHVVAQKIASKNKCMFNVQNVAHLNEELEKDIYKNSKAISLPSVDVNQLPEMLKFPQLELLLLSRKNSLQFCMCCGEEYLLDQSSKIPNMFFDGIKKLKVLVLSRVHLQSLAPSLSYLLNLKTLSLNGCYLKDINAIRKLDKLEILCFSNSDIEKLPEEIGELTRLKLLDLEYCSQLKVIPSNVLSKLTRLIRRIVHKK